MPVTLLNVLARVTRGLIFLIALTPLIVTNSLFFPYITGKAFFFRIVITLASALWLVLIALDKNYRPRRGWLVYAVTGLLAASLLATIFGLNPERSFWSNFERMEGFLNYFYVALYFFLLISVLKTATHWRWFWLTTISAGTLVALYGLMQLLGWWSTSGGASRLDSTFGNAAYLAGYLLFLFFLAIFWQRRRPVTWPAWPFWLVAGLGAVILYHTATRGSMIGLVAGLIVGSILLIWQEKSNDVWRRRAIWFLAAVFLLIGGFIVLRDSELVRSSEPLARLASISLDDATTSARLAIWKMSWQGFLERPILGWGPENFIAVFSKYYDPSLYGQEPWFDRAHNIFLDWLTSAGLLGLAAYLSLYVAAIYLLWRRINFSVFEKSALTGLFVAYGVHNVFVFDNLVSYLMFFALLAYLQFSAWETAPSENRGFNSKSNQQPPISGLIWPAAFLAIVWVLGSAWWLNGRPLALARGLINALSSSPPLERLEIFEQLTARPPALGRLELREQLVNQTLGVLRVSRDLPSAEAAAIIARAEEQIKQEVPANPGNPRPLMFLAAFYSNLGRYEEAVEFFKQALALSPRKQLLLLDLGAVYVAQEDYQSAFSVFNQAFRLDESSSESRLRYASGLILTRQFAAADEALLAGFGTTTVADPRLINAYAAAKQFDRVLVLWRVRAAERPDDFDAQISLAAAYYANDRRTEAVTVIEQAMTLKPEARTQLEELIRGVRAGTIDSVGRE